MGSVSVLADIAKGLSEWLMNQFVYVARYRLLLCRLSLLNIPTCFVVRLSCSVEPTLTDSSRQGLSQAYPEIAGIKLGTFCMQSMCSTTESHPLTCVPSLEMQLSIVPI